MEPLGPPGTIPDPACFQAEPRMPSQRDEAVPGKVPGEAIARRCRLRQPRWGVARPSLWGRRATGDDLRRLIDSGHGQP